MKKKKAHILVFFLLPVFPILLMLGGFFFCCHRTGFSPDKVTSHLAYKETWVTESMTEKQRELLVQTVFPQTYYYLAAGNQCYAFISEDGQYVIKFFKMQHLFPKGWLHKFPFSLLQHLGFEEDANNPVFSERIFSSYKDAYETLREETGLVYIHLNKTREFTSDISLIDKEGRKYTIDLDAVEFIVQKKATRIYEHLDKLRIANQKEELKEAIRSFLQLIAIRCEKGFVDQDLSIRNNFGYIGNTAIQFDCATLTRDSSMKFPSNFRQAVLEAAERLDDWARVKFPEGILLIQEEAQRIINQS